MLKFIIENRNTGLIYGVLDNHELAIKVAKKIFKEEQWKIRTVVHIPNDMAEDIIKEREQ